MPPLLLNLSNVRKAFPGVLALDQASFDLYEGEIHALVGENGAGKSTLIKILTGVHHRDAGDIVLGETPVSFATPHESQRAGIATIYQEFTLVPQLSVHANLFLGHELRHSGFIDASHEIARTREIFAQLNVAIDPHALVSELSVGQQQLVEIARALARDARILVMDEPTAALAPKEVDALFVNLRALAKRHMGIIFISHRLDEVFAIADRITVLRDGRTIGTHDAKKLSRAQLIEQMVGRSLDTEFPKAQCRIGDIRLQVNGLSSDLVREVSFAVRGGEVLGIAGLMGAGRTEVARLIFGADPSREGQIMLDGQRISIKSPRDAIKHGICLLTEDRKAQGLILRASARDNFSLPNVVEWSRFGFIRQRYEQSRFTQRVSELKIRLSGPDQLVESLSGGNQQKLLVARWLETNSKVVIFDEPTRGIDVGAKYEMYLLINKLAAEGKAIIMISSELPELIGMCDRIIVMRQGQVSGEIADVAACKQETVMALAV